jgi:carbamoyltransferase
MRSILGVHVGHDAAAALIIDGKIVADAAEERFSRVKHDASFPLRAIEFCLAFAGMRSTDVDAIALPSRDVPHEVPVFFDIPAHTRPRTDHSAMATVKRALRVRRRRDNPSGITLPLYQPRFALAQHCEVVCVDHHKAHASSAYYTSGLNDEKTLIVTMDGIGNGTSVVIWKGEQNRLECLKAWDGTASLGWFYSNCTEALQWRHGSDEWKTMGLAPFGTPMPGALSGFHPVFSDGELVAAHDYGRGGSWLEHAAYHYHQPDAPALQRIAERMGREHFAAEAQRVFEEQTREVIVPWLRRVGTRHLCAAGGAFLNVKANQRIWDSGQLETQWIYPNCGDAGLPAGAALCAYFERNRHATHERLRDAYFGPEFSNDEIQRLLDDRGLDYTYLDDPARSAAASLANNRIVGWFQGRMESGPRALGNRSILMSPLEAGNKDIVNRCVKYREAFRPFCPSILHERAADYLMNGRDERFMVTSFAVQRDKRDRIPAVVHVDGTARPQLVTRDSNPRYHALISAFGELTGEYAILNTSLNVKGEPIVLHPREAIRCYFDTGLDELYLGNFKLSKPKAPAR